MSGEDISKRVLFLAISVNSLSSSFFVYMSNVKVDFSNTGITTSEILKYSEKVAKIHEELHSKKDNEKELRNKKKRA